MVVLVAVGAFLIIWTVQAINTAVSGHPRGSLAGEGVVAASVGVAIFAVLLIVLGALLIAAWPVALVAIIIVSLVACATRKAKARGRS
jgi:hypothetical protein